MAANALRLCRMDFPGILLRICILLVLAVYSSYGDRDGCRFSEAWHGKWFQSGMPSLVGINATHMQYKGECAETDNDDKYLVYDRAEDCYRCMVIHAKHDSVLQYKETFCSARDSLSTLCESISGDAALYSMFRKYPEPKPQPCPFRPAPFSFTYSRGSGDCANPPSRAESCTDDSRLLLRYMACPDVPGTESNVEELICLAAWKEGSTRYLIGQISQVQRRNSIVSDEDTYRCFIYKGQHNDKSSTYHIAQSGDASCNGLSSPTDGSRTIKLTSIDDDHHRCRFPSWIVDHHKWYNLDHTHQYHFTTKNATLKIMSEERPSYLHEEKRLVCHSILEQSPLNQHIKLVAHVTTGCESGHMCLVFYRRDGNIIELQQGGQLWDSAHDACAEPPEPTYTTLITTTLLPMRCPIFGIYSVVHSTHDRRKRRQQLSIGSTDVEGYGAREECVAGSYDSVHVGCGAAQDNLEFKSSCSSTLYTCHGSWREGAAGLVVVAREAGARAALCLLYSHHSAPNASQVHLRLVPRACERRPGPNERVYNLTLNGTCEQSSMYNSGASMVVVSVLSLALTVVLWQR